MSEHRESACPCPLHPPEHLMRWLGTQATIATHAGRTSIMLPDEMFDRASMHLYGEIVAGLSADACGGVVVLKKGGWTDRVCDLVNRYDLAVANGHDDVPQRLNEMLEEAPWMAGAIVRDTHRLIRSLLRMNGQPDDSEPVRTCVMAAECRGEVH